MAFFQQLRLLLWKNWLTTIRQPLWSLTLITWPLIIFIIIAVTRTNFPPVLTDTCHVEPRNLPSTGFFPFLQTLMCNSDSNCRDEPRPVETATSRGNIRRHKRSMLKGLIDGDFKLALPNDPQSNPETLINILNNVFGSTSAGNPKNVSVWNTSATQENREGLKQMLESWGLAKKVICSIMLPMVNTNSPGAASYSVVSFCKSNCTVFELSLQKLNQFLLELMLTKPDEMATMAGMAMLVFDQLQNQTSLWDGLLIIPEILSSSSVDQGINRVKSLLISVQGTLRIIESSFPQVISALRTVHPVFAAGIDLLQYAQNWPGRAVSIPFGELVMLPNDSLSDTWKHIPIPLDKAIALAFDKEMVRRYLCSGISVQLEQLCRTGLMDTLLGSTIPDRVAKQVLLKWSKSVALQDIAFAKRLLHTFTGGQGGSNLARTRRSADVLPQSIEEELFLEVGKVLLELIKAVPEVDMVVQHALRTSFQSMQAATMVLDIVDVIIKNVLKDADRIQKTYLMLLSNQSAAAAWMSRVLDSVYMVINEVLSSDSVTCEEVLAPFEWLLNTESVKIELWRKAICQNSSRFEQALLMQWQPVVQKFQEIYGTITNQANLNATLPMILSEWHKLYNSSRFEVWLSTLPAELGAAYWSNWMPNMTGISETLLQSFSVSMVKFGEKMEKSQWWPQLKHYFHMVNWILNYRAGVTTQPANCQFNIPTSSILCDVNINWTEFVQALTRALTSPNQNVLLNLLKGSVKLLQDVFGSIYKHLASSALTQELKGGDAMATYLNNMLNTVDDFVKKITMLPDSNISDTELIRRHISNLLNSTGLSPVLPLLFSDQPLKVSAVIDAASKIGRLNQHIFTFNESDPTMPELERLIVKFLSMEENLTISLSHIMGHSLITYLKYIHPDDIALVRKSLKPYTDQTSSGIVEAILKTMELLKTVTDSPNGDPTRVLLSYIQQLQEFVISLYRLQMIERSSPPNGQLGPAQVTDLSHISKEFLSLLTPESLLNLTRAGPDAAQKIFIQKFVALLPPDVQAEAFRFLQDFKAVNFDRLGECGKDQNCLAYISELFTFLDKILEMVLSANGSVTLTLTTPNSLMRIQQYEEVASVVFSLLLSPNDAAYVGTFRQTLHFIKLVLAAQNVTVSDVQNALKQSGLTIEELEKIAALAGAANINDLIVSMMQVINVQECFDPKNDTMVTAQCVKGLANGVIRFLMNLPALRNNTAILSMVPLIVNNTVNEIIQSNFSSSPTKLLVHALNVTLANVKLSLQLNNLSTPEIMKEVRVLEQLIHLASIPLPYNTSFSAAMLMKNATYVQEVYLRLIDWYLNRIVAITNGSSVSHLLQHFVSLTQLQVTLQLANTDFTLFVSNQVEHLIKNLQYPIDGEGLHRIGLTSVAIFRRLFDLIAMNLELQSNASGSPLFHVLNNFKAAKLQVQLYLDLIEKWMKQPSVPSLLSSVLQWGSHSMNISAPAKDLLHLLQTLQGFLQNDQLSYLSIMSNISQSLNKALMLAEQPGGLQSDQFLAAIMEAVENAMQILNLTTRPLSLPVQHNILEIVHNSLKLILRPDMNFAASRNISLIILERAESVIRELIPGIPGTYIISGLKLLTTYFKSISSFNGQDNWNQLILNELKTIQSLLPENTTAKIYISVLINITQFVLESGQGNMSIWASFEHADLPAIFVQIGRILSKLWPLLTGTPGLPTTAASLKDLAHLAPVLEQLVTGKADEETWDKFERIVKGLLSMFKETQMWDSLPTVIPLVEKIMARVVASIQAQNMMILSLQRPLVTLMREIASTVNSSQANITGLQEKMQLAIEHTLKAAQQANGTLECSHILKVWEPVGAMVGLSRDAMAMWCNVSMQPVLDAYNKLIHLNMSLMGVGPMTVNTTAARIVAIVQSFYQAGINQTYVTQSLIMTFCNQFSLLMGQPLNHEAQLNWYNQLRRLNLESSLSSMKMLADELLKVAPFLHPYIRAVEKAGSHILKNLHLIQNNHTSEILFREAAMIFLSSANITVPTSGLNQAAIADMIRNVVKWMIDNKIFGHAPKIYQALTYFLASNDSSLIAQKVTDMFEWLSTTQASGLDLLTQILPQIYNILRPIWAVVAQINMDLSAFWELLEDLVENVLNLVRQLISTGGFVDHHGMFEQEPMVGYHISRRRHKREALPPPRNPMDDFIYLFQVDYSTMFRAMSLRPTSAEIMETVNVFLANPDLKVVLNGATRDMPWGLNASREETIHATLGILSFLTHPTTFETPSIDKLWDAVRMLPDGFPFAPTLKNISRALASESPETLNLMQQAFQTVVKLFQINPSDHEFAAHLQLLRAQVCKLNNTATMSVLEWTLYMEPGQLCHTLLPSLQLLIESLKFNMTSLSDAIFLTVIGDPSTYKIKSDWTSVLSHGLGFNTSSLHSLNINVTSLGLLTVGEMLRNESAFIADVQKHTNFSLVTLHHLMNTAIPNKNLMILSWLVNLRHCDSRASKEQKSEDVFLKTFCSMPAKDWYTLSVLTARHVNTEKVIYRMVLSDEVQTLMQVLLQAAKVITNMMNTFLPAINQLQRYLNNLEDLNVMADRDLNTLVRGQKESAPSQATFVTLSRALCRNGILALFGIAQMPIVAELIPSVTDNVQREEMIDRFKLPRNASPFCMSMYLDMVNTTGGAIAWAFLKPMLMGQILYTPDTPVTRAIMEKANATLNEFASLRKHSEDWIESSNYIMNSAEILSQTLPMLQNSLGNSFVQNFIEMQTDINVGKMKETLSNFSNMTTLLEKNRPILQQITTLSLLMVNLSSCITFDRYRGYNSTEELDSVAQDLAKNRNLYASVIFKLPKDSDSSRRRRAGSSSSASSLPPKVGYTIRMHMDNVMRTDRVRDPFFIKDAHISARQTLRYNRGFVYLQENIERAIIETHAGHPVAEPAVQLQPFPYPCHLRDEYLEAISYVFPLMLMMAWMLFVADFVKKLVHERELRLHEYMKMMGVNPLSHFFAWFLECATYLVLTIIILTLVLKCGHVLPNSNGFLLFLYFCDYALSVLAFSYLIGSFFDKTYIAGLSGSLIYILCFFPFIIVMAVETTLTFSQKSLLSLFSPTCFSYAGQYISRYEVKGEGIHWNNMYISPVAGDTASFGWLCWLMLIDSIIYFLIGAYIRMVFPGKYGIPAPWYFPFKGSFWADLCCSFRSNKKLLFTNIMQNNHPVFLDDKEKDQSSFSSQAGENFSHLPVGVSLHGLSKLYGDRVAIQNLNVSFYEGHVTTLLGHNGAGKTTTMSLLTGLFAPSAGSIEVYGKDMQTNTDEVRKELGVCMQYDVLFDHMTTKEHLLLYGQIKAPHWTPQELREQVRTILEETGMYAHRHKRVCTLSGGMKRKLSISIAFIGGSRLVVLDEPTTGVDPCSRRSIWDIVIQSKTSRTIIMSTHHLDEAEVLSDRVAFLERGRLKCCGSPFHLKDKLGQGYKLTLTKKMPYEQAENMDNADLKSFIQAHVPEARLKDSQKGDLVYSLPPFSSSNASSYRSLLTSLDANLDDLHLGGYGISDTTLEEVFLQLTQDSRDEAEDRPLSISETLSDSGSIDSFPSDLRDSVSNFGDKTCLTGSSTVSGIALAWQQMTAILIKRFHHSRRDWKGLLAQILLPVLFVLCAMGLGSIKNDLRHYPELELSPALYNFNPSYSFFSNQNPNSSHLIDTMMSSPGIDNACLLSNNQLCESKNKWTSSGSNPSTSGVCKCTYEKQVCDGSSLHPPYTKVPSSQIVYNVTGINVDNYLVTTANDFIRNRYGGFSLGMPLPTHLKLDLKEVPKNRTLSKVWFNPEGHHTMPAYLNSLNNLILRSNVPAGKDPQEYAISVSSHPYFGRADDEDLIIQGLLQILVAICVLTGYSITTASFAIYEVSEHNSGAKRLQHIAGISEPFYWTVNFLYDMFMYLIPVTLTVGVIAAFQLPAFSSRENLGAVALLLVLFGFSTFPWMYLLAGILKSAETAFITYVCINLFISVNTILSTSILYFLGQIASRNVELIQDIFKRLSLAFLIFPQFNFGNGLMELARMDIEVQLLSGYGIDAYKNPFSLDVLGWMLISSIIQGLVFFTLRLLLNKFIIRRIRHFICKRKKVPPVVCEDEDEDVSAEHQRVASGAASSDLLQVIQLTKVYQHLKRKVHAVKKLSVGIPAGECFGLLGVNGAGKTTTFRMLTGDIIPTNGTAQIRDWDGRLVDIMECRQKGINIGYCPQVDALDSLLTGEEHLYFYGRIRGISKKELDRVVNYLLRRLELDYHRSTITDGYSCGTRRKLSTALALIGHPQILLLDEPSSGMDPRTKRHLWKIISEEVKGKCAVVLTSHSMEECEALCSRLAIMVKGQFRCLGSLQHIKNRFGSGFTVKMYLAEGSCSTDAITSLMQDRFPSTYLKDQHSSMVEYHVSVAPGGVADIFDQLESNKSTLRIKHFSVSQTTLDEVFINFAMESMGTENIPLHGGEDSDDPSYLKEVDAERCPP